MSNSNNKENQNNEIVDLEWQEVEEIFMAKSTLSEIEEKFALLSLQWEKTKVSYMSEILSLESSIRTTAEQLMVNKGLDQSHTYELKLPAISGEKGYFLRRDEN